MSDVQGNVVDIPTEDGVADAYLVHPADGRPRPGVLLYQDAYGLRPHLRSMADRLAGAGYTVLVPNVFYRLGRAPVVDLPEFIDPDSDPTVWERLGPILAGLTPDLVKRDAGAYLRWLADSSLVTAGGVALTGYCMGARLALWTAGAHPDRVAAAAGFHGGQLATDAPSSPHLEAPRITAELYFGHADEDPSLTPEQMARFEEALSAAGVRHTCEVYTGAHHGYTQADTSAYDRVATERHWAALLALLERTF
ncbi:dienelactone hydrolase family protein [Streptomyces sp. 5-8]|uniref:Dienelactone hydrolase family protein n=1 Tax=Streptomyces musisoli TaxID=2802280 RepID=A0ABS1P7X1_9ACTN|nr:MULTISPECIES: dienelactone hydrolase family protein [Streptomyces]MBL1108477.1 dienelactone hydrolase family protein [Streptomyces musisoli]MBY8846037.1 dienelactone hydrolase family protein [Streptomyces sp. SP2-10]